MKPVFEAGAAGAAVISAVLDAVDVREAAAGLLAAGLPRGASRAAQNSLRVEAWAVQDLNL